MQVSLAGSPGLHPAVDGAVDGAGNAYVTDSLTSTVFKVTPFAVRDRLGARLECGAAGVFAGRRANHSWSPTGGHRRSGLARRENDPHDSRAVREALTPRGARLADRFYTDACRRVEQLPAGLDAAGRDALAGLRGRVVRDNDGPVVFVEPGHGAAAVRG
ncbi:MarR family winged helix-turn-helix transcriptional regulator [Streptomyces monashensis]|uniref:MarR family winged helix-turn-helix transcriptional regulator n=1 Tax=Streptomyces monashensis TaxID=1678012 RepID=UPI0015A510F9|nr:MarR family winged helix-turn-helix transcriptional regulator [Streptomyces monashensis]